MKRIIDVSLPIGPDLLTWPGDPGIRIEAAKRIDRGDAANVSEFHLGSHTGTHIDPPVHFLPGHRSIEELDLAVFFGPAVVADLRGAGEVGPAELYELDVPEGTERLLCRTRNSELWTRLPVRFPEDYVAVTPDGARWVVDRGIRLLGVDFLSVEKLGTPDHPVHRTLLGGGTVIVEGLDLSHVQPGGYTLACFPLRIKGGDGSPARAVLIEP
ncbi:MAG: cyclase family protein [Actinomycetota bacterium]